MRRVFIGVGHGGRDPGAAAGDLLEKDINLAVAKAMRDELVRCGVETALSREADQTAGVAEELRLCRAFAPDLAVEVHNNAGGGRGFEVFRQTDVHAAKSAEIARCIEKRVVRMGQRSRGIKTHLNSAGMDWFAWLRDAPCPAVLCEGAFLDNADDRAWIATAQAQARFGAAYAQGVMDYLGVSAQPQPTLYGVVCQVAALRSREAAEQHAQRLNREGDGAVWYKVIPIERQKAE